jgi:hypothetical protein
MIMRIYIEILTHRLHLDEALAIVFLLLFGKKKGIDVTKAKVKLVHSNRLPGGKTWKQLDDEGVFVLAEGGSPSDEHGKDPKKRDKCAALLIAEKLGIAEDGKLRLLIEEVRLFDRRAEATQTALGTVMKDCYAAGRRSVSDVMSWSITGALDLVRYHISGKDLLMDDKAYAEVFSKAWHDVAQASPEAWTEEMRDRMMRIYAASATNAQKLLTDLSYVYFARYTMSGKEKADAWLYEAAYDMVVYQRKFFAARDEFLAKARVVRTWAWVNGQTVPIRVAAIRSDSEVMNKVFRSSSVFKRLGRIDALVQKKSSGNVGVFLNHSSRLPSDDLARMLRWREDEVQGREHGLWDKLDEAETMESIEEWFYHRTDVAGASAFYNGSLSHPDVPPTQIKALDLLEIVVDAFHPDSVKRWRRKHNAFDPRPIKPKKERRKRRSQSEIKAKRKERKQQRKSMKAAHKKAPPEIDPKFATIDRISLGDEIERAKADRGQAVA